TAGAGAACGGTRTAGPAGRVPRRPGLSPEVLRCFEHPISEEQAWAICFQCCCKMKQLAQGLNPSLHSVFIKGPGSIFIHADGFVSLLPRTLLISFSQQSY
uniref:KIND domain-containing protein n=1 Tax=Anser cygnoides TaxID=8845 RepID=A0A8B9DHV2_ANSCY